MRKNYSRGRLITIIITETYGLNITQSANKLSLCLPEFYRKSIREIDE